MSMLNPRSPLIGCLFSAKSAFENSHWRAASITSLFNSGTDELTTFAAVTRPSGEISTLTLTFPASFVWRTLSGIAGSTFRVASA